tara:strand:+ start:125 stop:505 length:381 start_codon:yes stop_codon:yes gene_type:complete
MLKGLKDKIKSKVAEKATEKAMEVGAKAIIGKASERFSKKDDSANPETSEAVDGEMFPILSKHLGTIRTVLKEKCPDLVKEVTQDDESVKRVGAVAYELLPLPLRIAVTEERFTAFLLTYRDKFFS